MKIVKEAFSGGEEDKNLEKEIVQLFKEERKEVENDVVKVRPSFMFKRIQEPTCRIFFVTF